MIEPTWLDVRDALLVHDRQLAEHGGGTGVRDPGLLESAMARPVNSFTYGKPDLADLAAAYAFGIARNHPFVDGNKRTAWVIARLFLRVNKVQLRFDKVEAINIVLELAAGELDEEAVAKWFRNSIGNDGSA